MIIPKSSNDQISQNSNPSCLASLHSVIVPASYLRVSSESKGDGIDLPELTSIRLGASAFWFRGSSDDSELVMRSDSLAHR